MIPGLTGPREIEPLVLVSPEGEVARVVAMLEKINKILDSLVPEEVYSGPTGFNGRFRDMVVPHYISPDELSLRLSGLNCCTHAVHGCKMVLKRFQASFPKEVEQATICANITAYRIPVLLSKYERLKACWHTK